MEVTKPSPAAFAKPTEIIKVLPNFVYFDGNFDDVAATVYRTLVSLLGSIVFGGIIGFFVVNISIVKTEIELIIDFLRSIPATALVPIFLVVFGLGDTSKIAVGIFSGGLALLVSIVVSFKSLDKDRSIVADTISLHGFRRFLLYQLPEMLPAIFVGLRTAVSLCLILVVVSEMSIGASNGIGKLIMDFRYSDNVPMLYASLVVSGIIGYAFNRIIYLIDILLTNIFNLPRA